MLMFMLTCVTCTSYVTSLGWGGGDVNLHVNAHLRHMHNAHLTLRHWVGGVGMLTFMLTWVTCTSYVTSLGWGVGMLTFMLTWVTCTSYVTSLGWGGGDVNVHVHVRHAHIVRYVTGLGGGDIYVHVHLRHMHNANLTLRHWVAGWGC